MSASSHIRFFLSVKCTTSSHSSAIFLDNSLWFFSRRLVYDPLVGAFILSCMTRYKSPRVNSLSPKQEYFPSWQATFFCLTVKSNVSRSQSYLTLTISCSLPEVSPFFQIFFLDLL